MQSFPHRDSPVRIIEHWRAVRRPRVSKFGSIYDGLRPPALFLHRLWGIGTVPLARGALMAIASLQLLAGCPIPTDFQIEPKPPNYPPVVDSTRTTSFDQNEVVITNARPIWSLWVADANPEDILRVKVIKDLHQTLEPDSVVPLTILLETSVFPSDLPPPEEGLPDDLRTKMLELAFTPCPAGAEGSRPVLTICISDREFQNPTATQKNPCLPVSGGYATSYSVLVQCIAAP